LRALKTRKRDVIGQHAIGYLDGLFFAAEFFAPFVFAVFLSTSEKKREKMNRERNSVERDKPRRERERERICARRSTQMIRRTACGCGARRENEGRRERARCAAVNCIEHGRRVRDTVEGARKMTGFSRS